MTLVNLVKTQENEAETSGSKQLDLTPMNHGYIYICTKDTPDKSVKWVNDIIIILQKTENYSER